MKTQYLNAFHILRKLKEEFPRRVAGHDLRDSKRMRDEDFNAAINYLLARGTVEGNPLPGRPLLAQTFALSAEHVADDVNEPTDLLYQDFILGMADYAGQTINPYSLFDHPLSRDHVFVDVVLDKLARKNLIRVPPAVDASGRTSYSVVDVLPQLAEAAARMEAGIKDQATTEQTHYVFNGPVVNIQGNQNAVAIGNGNVVTSTANHGIDGVAALAAIEKVVELLKAHTSGQVQTALMNEAEHIRTEVKSEMPKASRLRDYWETLMSTIQGAASVPALIEAVKALGIILGCPQG